MTYDLDKPRIVPGAVPSQMPNCPDYLSAAAPSMRRSRDEKLQERENLELADAILKSQKQHEEQQKENKCQNFQDIKAKLKLESPWKLLDNGENLWICTADYSEEKGPFITKGITIDNHMMAKAYVHSEKLSLLGKYNFPYKITTLTEIIGICDGLVSLACDLPTSKVYESFILCLNVILSLLLPLKDDSFKLGSIIKFVYEQLHLMKRVSMCYSSEFLIFSSLFYNVSPQAYRFLRRSGNILLPCYNTIRKITLSSSMSPSVEQTDNTFLFYIKQKIRSLTSSDTTVMLLVDEIHLKPFYDYKGGTVIGTSFNNCTAAAKSAFAFMINSVISNYKDVVHLLPTSKISAEDLHLFLKKIICGLENIGFRVFAVITDNNAINRKAMSQFAVPSKLSIAYPHPCDQKRPLFFVFDSVHILKCIRNNWLNLKSHDKCFAFPHFQFGDISTKSSTSYALASFSSLVQLHNTKCDSLIKFAYKLSYKALNPSTFERQNVKLALQIFNNFTAEALEILREKTQNPFNSDTQAFIKIIVTWWKIVNVKTPNK